MPLKSKAQMRLLFSKENKGELPRGTAERWVQHTPGLKDLPEKKAFLPALLAAGKAALPILNTLGTIGMGIQGAQAIGGLFSKQPQGQQQEQEKQGPIPGVKPVEPIKPPKYMMPKYAGTIGKGLEVIGKGVSSVLPAAERFVQKGTADSVFKTLERNNKWRDILSKFDLGNELLKHRAFGNKVVGAATLAAPVAGYGAYRGVKAMVSAPNKGKNTAEELPESPEKTAEHRSNAFKLGFLLKLAEEGVTPDKFFNSFKKQADLFDPVLSGGVDAAKQVGGLLSKGLGYGGVAAIAAPVVAGGIAGAGHGLLDAPNAKDLDLMRKAEILGLYNRLAQDIKQRQLHRNMEA